MTQYRCDSCNALRNDPVCPVCLSDTREIEPDAASLEGLAAVVSRNAGPVQPLPTKTPPKPERPKPEPVKNEPPKAAPRKEENAAPPPSSGRPTDAEREAARREAEREAERRDAEKRREAEERREAAATPQPVEPSDKDIRGLEEFHALLDRGVKAIIVCGKSKGGKSELAAGFIRANNVYRGRDTNLTLRATLRTDYVLGSTLAGEVWYQIIDHKLTFLDPSGEFFNRLSPDYRHQFKLPDITESDFQFVQRAVRALAGVVIAVDLMDAVDPKRTSPWRRQEDDLKFVLSALRWLRFDKEARPDAIGLTTNITQRVSDLPLLDVPVLVLFTKGDRLKQLTVQNPLDFAKQRLTTLHGGLMTHARRFRYDFCHTMENTPAGDQAVDYPCGVLLPMEWLMSTRSRWLRWQLPTRWIGGGK